MTGKTEIYHGRTASVGNSRGIRLEAAFFKSHGLNVGRECTVRPLAGDTFIVSFAGVSGESALDEQEQDPVFAGFLQFLENDMIARPESISPADDLLAEMEALVGDSVQD
tara:strand:+ start:528 stop:857 length:330 start_codon:yes stop_codon:yes gene_type:complete